MPPARNSYSEVHRRCLLEANDDWQLQHRYMQIERMAELFPLPVAANKAFACGLAEADRLLERCGQNVSALDTKGLALCGIALCEDQGHLTPAEQAIGAARRSPQPRA